MIVFLCGLISFYYNFVYSITGEQVQTISAVFFFTAYLVIPTATLLTIAKFWRQINDKGMEARYGEIYANLNIERGKKVLLAPTNFLLRRAFLVMLVFFGTDVFIFQIALICLISIVVPSTLHRAQAFKQQGELRLETFSEIIIL